MDEMITKKQAIEAISKANGLLYWNNTLKASLIKLINEIPSAEEESFEWCTECGQGRTVAPHDYCSYAEKREEN